MRAQQATCTIAVFSNPVRCYFLLCCLLVECLHWMWKHVYRYTRGPRSGNMTTPLSTINMFETFATCCLILQDAAQRAEVQAYVKSNTPDVWGRRARAKLMIEQHKPVAARPPFKFITMDPLAAEDALAEYIAFGLMAAWRGLCHAGRKLLTIAKWCAADSCCLSVGSVHTFSTVGSKHMGSKINTCRMQHQTL